MRQADDRIVLSATDLGRHLACRHLTQLDRAAAEGRLKAPHWEDPILDALRERGMQHEKAYEDHLRAEGLAVVRVEDRNDTDAVSVLMRDGADVIVQAPLGDDRFGGIADFLRKVGAPSALGGYSYEVVDTKLAQNTRAGTILQLSLYSELIGNLQGRPPERMHVAKPGDPFERDAFRCADFGAYYRLVKGRLRAVIDGEPDDSTYPTPVSHCEVCRWWRHCMARRRADDHLCLVAGMSTLHATEFQRQAVTTLEQLGEADRALPDRPERGSAPAFERLREQARIQLVGRRAGRLVYELLPLEPDRGLLRLPEPSPGDVFFDLEAARFYGDGGLEYLFGWCVRDGAGGLDYHRRWARDRAEERRALEEFIAVVMERWRRYDGMHIYHFAPYEPSALKRLIGRYGSCERELDSLLRGGRLVDLHAVARQGVRASVERYSLKDLELLAGFERAVDLREASRARRRIEAALDTGHVDGILPADGDIVEGYNREDCEATAVLRDWLEARRQEWIDGGTAMPRPELRAGEPSEKVEQRTAEVQAAYDALTATLPDDRLTWNHEHRTVWLLAEMLNYYRREMNCSHWEFFRVHDLEFEDLLEERTAIAGLEFVGAVGGKPKYPVHRYRYPDQEHSVDEGRTVYPVGDTLQALGKVVAVDPAARTVDIKKRGDSADIHPESVMADKRVEPGAKVGSLLAFAMSVARDGMDRDGSFRAGRDLLLGLPPRRAGHPAGPVRLPGEDLLACAKRVASELEAGVLPIQGPPGSGKTFTGARMIAELSSRGARIGVTAVGHKVIQRLLEEVAVAAGETGVALALVHKDGTGAVPEGSPVLEVTTNDAALSVVAPGAVVGGTAWLWSRDDAVEALDYLFVDEAGQMALADVLAVSRSARNIVLLGDPQQLEQPQQAAHPEGTDAAALVHLLMGHRTLPPGMGLFLDETWRLHPALCAFTSELYYEDRLASRPDNERQVIAGPTRFEGAGPFVVPVQHAGNQSVAVEEVDAVRAIVEELLRDGVTWTDREGTTKPLAPDDVLIVAPYNAQIAALHRALPDMRIGTVDKFQGQEAPVVIYSTTSSTPDDAPRGMGFLYNPNRLNVATSRARGVVVLVTSPQLFEPDCRTPDQMRWANGLCRYRELAKETRP